MFDKFIKHKKVLLSLLTFAMLITMLPGGFGKIIQAASDYCIELYDQYGNIVEVNGLNVELCDEDGNMIEVKEYFQYDMLTFDTELEPGQYYNIVVRETEFNEESMLTITSEDADMGTIVMSVNLKTELVTLKGKITDSSGNPVKNVELNLVYDSIVMHTPDSPHSDENGEFAVNVYAGAGITYNISAYFEANYQSLETSFEMSPELVNEGVIDMGEIQLQSLSAKVNTSIEGDANGTITESFEADLNSTHNVEVKADDTYVIDSLTVNGTEITEASGLKEYTHELKSIQEDKEVVVSFKLQEFNITTSVDDENKGSISEDSTVTVGDDTKIKVKANSIYVIDSLTVNGTEITEASGLKEYTLELNDIHEDKDVIVTFKPDTFVVKFNVGENGKVYYEESLLDGYEVSVEATEDPAKVKIEARPEEGYKVSNVKIDGQSQIIADENDYVYTTILTVDKKETILIFEFDKNVYNVNLEKEDKFISSDKLTVTHGETVNITIDPEVDQVIDYVLVNDEQLKPAYAGNKYVLVLENVNAHMDVKAVYKDIEVLDQSVYTEVMDLDNPVVSEDLEYIYNDNITVSLKENSGYKAFRYNGSKELVEKIDLSVKTDIYSIDLWDGSEFKRIVFAGESPLELNIDKSAPVLVLDNGNSNEFTNETITVTGTVSNEQGLVYSSELVKVIYYTGDETPQYADLTDGKFSIDFDKTVDAEYTFYAVDKAGNESVFKQLVIKVDKDLPVFESAFYNESAGNGIKDYIIPNQNKDHNQSYSSDKVRLDVTVSDAHSGISNVVIRNDEEVIESVYSKDGLFVFVLTEEDYADGKEVVLEVTDITGNTTAAKLSEINEEYSDYLKINASIPVAEIVLNDSEYYKDSERYWTGNVLGDTLTFTVNIDDAFDISHYEIRLYKTIAANYDTYTEVEEFAYDVTEESEDKKSITFTFDKTLVEKDSDYKLVLKAVNQAGKEGTEECEFSVDNSKPLVTGFEFESVNSGKVAKFINFLTFGLFFNESVNITVSSYDGELSSGLKETYLTYGEHQFGPAEIKDGKSTFNISIEDIEKLQYNGLIAAWVVDYCGNESEHSTYKYYNKETGLMIETVKPEIDVTADKDPEYKTDTQDWYADQVVYSIELKDNESGIQNITAYIEDVNGKKNIYDKSLNTVSVEESKTHLFTLSTDGLADGELKLYAEVTDKAQNTETYEKVFYKDNVTPEVEFKVLEDGQWINIESKLEGYIYTNYKNKNETVRVYIDDAEPSSGLKHIEYVLMNYNEEENRFELGEDVTVEAEDFITDESGCYIEVTLNEKFKGNIFAKATDNVSNTPEASLPGRTIVESQESHDSKEHITLTKPEASYKDINRLDLYSGKVEVTMNVKDEYNGISRVEWNITSDRDNQLAGNNVLTIDNNGKLTEDAHKDMSGEWSIKDQQFNIITEIEKTITIPNNSNNITLTLTMYDRSGNTSTETMTFSTDTTKPVIELSYDNNTPDSEYTDFYNADRVATITVTERNFDAKDIAAVFTNTDGWTPSIDLTDNANWKTVKDENDADADKHILSFVYDQDGDFTFDISYKDLAENESNKVHDEFTMDKTNPILDVEYDNNNALNGNYYAADRTATIVIVEHNFDPSRVTVLGTATDNGAEATFPVLTEWKSNNDVYVATIHYGNDSLYEFDIEYIDMAGNSIADYAKDTFYIDKTAPEIEISGVEDLVAYNDVIAPSITFTDTNYNINDVHIELAGVNTGKAEFYPAAEQIANGELFSYADFERIEAIDDIYTLYVEGRDMAGNETTSEIIFSVNRFGSTYDLSKLEYLNGKYVKYEDVTSLEFTEINVDSVDQDSVKIKLIKNNEASILTEGTDYTVTQAGGNGKWSRYTYKINKELVKDDANYEITIYSEDAANNINENIDERKDSDGKVRNELISFGIDNTIPVVVPIDLETNGIYDGKTKDVVVNIRDNLLLDRVDIRLNGEVVTYTNNGDDYTFTINESPSRQKVEIYAYDAANNEALVEVLDITVSDNFFVRWFNNTPVFIASMAALVAALGGLYYFFASKKKKEETEQ